MNNSHTRYVKGWDLRSSSYIALIVCLFAAPVRWTSPASCLSPRSWPTPTPATSSPAWRSPSCRTRATWRPPPPPSPPTSPGRIWMPTRAYKFCSKNEVISMILPILYWYSLSSQLYRYCSDSACLLSAALACFLHLLVIVQYIILCLWHIKLRNSIKDYILLKYCFDKYPRGCVRSSSSGCLTLKVCTALWELAHGEFGWLRQSIDFVSQPSSEHPTRPCISDQIFATDFHPAKFRQTSWMGGILFFISRVESTGLYISQADPSIQTGGLRQLQYSCAGEHYWTVDTASRDQS